MGIAWRDVPDDLRKRLLARDPSLAKLLQPASPTSRSRSARSTFPDKPRKLSPQKRLGVHCRGYDVVRRVLPEPSTERGIYRVSIPRWRPALLDELTSFSLRKRMRCKRIDRDMIAYYLGPHHGNVPVATGRRRVWLEIQRPRPMFPDTDNIWKSILDALVYHDFLIDDCKEAHAKEDPIYTPGPILLTTIVLEDLV